MAPSVDVAMAAGADVAAGVAPSSAPQILAPSSDLTARAVSSPPLFSVAPPHRELHRTAARAPPHRAPPPRELHRTAAPAPPRHRPPLHRGCPARRARPSSRAARHRRSAPATELHRARSGPAPAAAPPWLPRPPRRARLPPPSRVRCKELRPPAARSFLHAPVGKFFYCC
jgi:hypothetical protein